MAVTRDHVARAAGVSPAVVSYVLNGGPRPVSEQARQRVLRAVAELGYRPDALARSLRSGRSDTIGLIVSDGTNPSSPSSPARSRTRPTPSSCAYWSATALTTSPANGRASRTSPNGGSPGLVLISVRGDEELADLITLSIPVVAVDRSPDDSPISTVRLDNVHGARLATNHLIEHGHRRIGLVAGPAETGVITDRARGWRDGPTGRALLRARRPADRSATKAATGRLTSC